MTALTAAASADEYRRHRRYIEERTEWYTRGRGVGGVVDYWDVVVAQHRHRPYCQSAHSSVVYSYGQAEEISSRLSHVFLSRGVLRPSAVDAVHSRHTVGLLMENCPHFLFTWLALAKLGVTIALLNTHIVGAQLRAAVATAGARVVVVSRRMRRQWRAAEALMGEEERQRLTVLHSLGWETERKDEEAFAAAPATPTRPSSASSAVSPSTSYASLPSIHRSEADVGAAVNSDDSDDDDGDGWLEESLSSFPSSPQPRSLRAGLHMDDPLFYVFTSGTSGPSKAAYFSHRRFLGAGVTWTYPMALSSADVYYVALPLFHGNGGVVAVSAAWNVGCRLVLRDRLSVRHFWPEVRRHRVTAMIHVGEVWRYLHSQAAHEDDRRHSLRVIAGNGLRGDIWQAVVERFGIRTVVEHYGLTEMPAGPHMQWMGRVGACGFIPPAVRAAQGADRLIAFDAMEGRVIRRPPSPSSEAEGLPGRCCEVEVGQAGECVFKLAGGLDAEKRGEGENPHVPSDAKATSQDVNPHYRPYDGYTDKAASTQRVYRHVFDAWDAWFGTGDLLRWDADGFLYFVDRMGDTFRWKGENVSASDVAEVVAAFPQCAQTTVYGVHFQGRDGRAGMAAIKVRGGADEAFDFAAFFGHCYAALPPFALPIFVRLVPALDETATRKVQKYRLVKEGFDPALVSDAVFSLDAKACTYTRLTADTLDAVLHPSYRGYDIAK